MEKELVRHIRLYDILFHRADLLNVIRIHDFFYLVDLETNHYPDPNYSLGRFKYPRYQKFISPHQG